VCNELVISRNNVFKDIIVIFILISISKYTKHYLLKIYRSEFGRNYRNTVIFGDVKSTLALQSFFEEGPEYGYILKKIFNLKKENDSFLNDCLAYIREESVDEIYCSISDLNSVQINKIIEFADDNLKKVKFIPDHKEVFSKKMYYEYYGYIPILSLRNIPLESSINMIVKRLFDIVFASIIIVFILSWLVPLLGICIRIESKGSIFFSQKRNGINNKEFSCYKFRSMVRNNEANSEQATRNDIRVTKMGKFMRSTSIDELPQFFNVLNGDMSVIGPRPHMIKHNEKYAKKVKKFMVRNFVKPGITGLAQVKGYRGEIETDSDIINRIKFDLFYIENWSFLLDLKIVLQTVTNVVKGEDKAY